VKSVGRWALWICVGAALLIEAACASVTASPPATSPPAPASAVVADSEVARLPTIEVADGPKGGDTFVVFYSGDTGWTVQSREFAESLAARGAPVVGVNSMRYFLTRRTADEAAADLGALIDHYGRVWGRDHVILVGYSFGGDVLPLFASHLPQATRARVRLIALISPTDYGDLAFRVVSWWDGRWPGSQPLDPALKQLAGVPMVCIYAAHDPRAACKRFPADVIRPIRTPGGHRYTGRHDLVGAEIASAAGLTPMAPSPPAP